MSGMVHSWTISNMVGKDSIGCPGIVLQDAIGSNITDHSLRLLKNQQSSLVTIKLYPLFKKENLIMPNNRK